MPIIPKPGDPLTDRELEVLRLVAFGQSNRRIANALATAEDTIKTHLRHVFCKLDARDRAHAVALAQQSGALTMPPGSTPHVVGAAAAYGSKPRPTGKTWDGVGTYAAVTATPGTEPIDYRGRGA